MKNSFTPFKAEIGFKRFDRATGGVFAYSTIKECTANYSFFNPILIYKKNENWNVPFMHLRFAISTVKIDVHPFTDFSSLHFDY